MRRAKLRYFEGKWTPVEEIPESYNPNRSELACPMIISDQMDALQHQATGLYTDSKSTFRKMTRDSGCIEVGDQAPTANVHQKTAADSKAARVDAIKSAIRETGGNVL